jgi:hypothetical protein
MSQWQNRFHVLAENTHNIPSDETTTISQPALFPSISTSTPTLTISPSLPQRIYIRSLIANKSTQVQIQLKTLDTGVKMSVTALLDSGATGMFLDSNFIKENQINTRKLQHPIPVYNVDGTLNQGGSIQEEVDLVLSFKNHTEKTTFAVCDLGDKAAIIGHTWLVQHNPEIDWRTGEVSFSRCPPNCHVQIKSVCKKEKNKQKRRRSQCGKLPYLPVEEESE